MKRYIKSSDNFNSELTEYFTFNHGRQEFSCHAINTDTLADADLFRATVSEIHPYNDAEYAWAQIGKIQPLHVRYIREGKVIDVGMLPDYNDEAYESEQEYYDAILDKVAIRLLELNKDVKPIMVHN